MQFLVFDADINSRAGKRFSNKLSALAGFHFRQCHGNVISRVAS